MLEKAVAAAEAVASAEAPRKSMANPYHLYYHSEVEKAKDAGEWDPEASATQYVGGKRRCSESRRAFLDSVSESWKDLDISTKGVFLERARANKAKNKDRLKMINSVSTNEGVVMAKEECYYQCHFQCYHAAAATNASIA